MQFGKLWDTDGGVINSFCYKNRKLEKLSKSAFLDQFTF